MAPRRQPAPLPVGPGSVEQGPCPDCQTPYEPCRSLVSFACEGQGGQGWDDGSRGKEERRQQDQRQGHALEGRKVGSARKRDQLSTFLERVELPAPYTSLQARCCATWHVLPTRWQHFDAGVGG